MPFRFPPTFRGRDREGGQHLTPGPGSVPPPDSSRSVSRAAIAAAVFLAVIGLALFGQGIWIFAKAVLAQILLERAFAETIATGRVVKPWPWADTWPVARIAVPRLGKSAIVLAGSSGQALAFGPGHVERTPIAGERGTAVYSAHRETHFAFLGNVGIGDEIRVTRADGAEVGFRVTGTSVVRWDASGIDPLAPGQNLVLATCWPLDGTTSGPLRYLVHAVAADAGERRDLRVSGGPLAAVVH
jgi:sortase A